jgi:RNA recognition motif-containing protein
MTLYIENLPEAITPTELSDLFAPYGRVGSADVATRRDTGEGLGIGFVEMDRGGEDAVRGLDGAAYHGRTLSVTEVLPLGELDPALA